jgi:hypothetical protein
MGALKSIIRQSDIHVESLSNVASSQAISNNLGDQALQESLSCGCTGKGIVLLFGHVDSNNEMLFRPPDLSLQLTKLLKSDSFSIIHSETSCLRLYLVGTYILTGGFFFGSLFFLYKYDILLRYILYLI